MEPRIQYAQAADGASIAFCAMGEGTPFGRAPGTAAVAPRVRPKRARRAQSPKGRGGHGEREEVTLTTASTRTVDRAIG